MNHSEAFFRLGLPVTLDKNSIRKAYQQRVHQHHPEEDPQGFMLLHQAYKTALNYAQGIRRTMSCDTVEPVPTRQVSREENSYDGLFSSLEEKVEEPVDISAEKRIFSREILRLRLHWLPVSVYWWRKFFTGDVFQACRKDPDCMEKLFALLVRKVHTFGAFHFLFNQLWELDNWQKNTGLDELAKKTQACIEELSKQYSHYLKLGRRSPVRQRICPALWNYAALPFFFKLAVSTFLLPLLTFGHTTRILLLLLIYYLLEWWCGRVKKSHELGPYRPYPKEKRASPLRQKPADRDLFSLSIIFGSIFHIGFCAMLAEMVADWV